MSADHIPLVTAKSDIVEALRNFDFELGKRAAVILYSDEGSGPKRLNIIERYGEESGMMACRPAGVTINDLKKADMYLEPESFKKEHPGFTEQENPNDYAIVDFKYVGTQHSLTYLAHEIGHAIADDIQREHGLSFRDFWLNELEEQAYFVQSIVEDHLSGGEPKNETELKKDPDFCELSEPRQDQVVKATKSYADLCHQPPEERHRQVVGLLSGWQDTDVLSLETSEKPYEEHRIESATVYDQQELVELLKTHPDYGQLSDKLVTTRVTEYIEHTNNPDNGNQLFIARDNAQHIIGLAYIIEDEKRDGKFLVDDLYTHPAHQGCGIGSQLLDQCKEYAFSSGHSALQLNVEAGNDELVEFYENRGWTKQHFDTVAGPGSTDIDPENTHVDTHLMRADLNDRTPGT